MQVGVSVVQRLAARLRVPLVAVGAAVMAGTLLVGLGTEPPVWLGRAGLAVFVVGLALYVRVGTPDGDTVDIASPVRGRWRAVNSPSSRVPSHLIHGWSQTYAIDLIHEPGDRRGPAFGWWPLARRPEEYPGFGQPVVAPVDGTVVRAFGAARDHWSRTSPAGLAYLLLEGVRELAGPPGVLGNHVVVRRDDGVCVLVAHLRRRSLRVGTGDRVCQGDQVAECGNSGNSTEPHLHCQVMDHPSVWVAAGLRLRVDGSPLPRNGELLDAG
jgi:murein DD-endopeptidase MepM/ murein hydrolase activator NlpD